MASDTRDRMITTTASLLRRQGYAATGLNQVMAEAGAPKGSMYFHFPGGKEELAAAAVDRFAASVTRRLEAGLASAGSVVDAVDGFFDDYVSYFQRTEFRDGCAVATVALDEASTHDLLADAASRALRTWVDLLATALVDEGREPTEAHDLATLVIATIEGVIVMSKGMQSTEPITAARHALHALLVPPG